MKFEKIFLIPVILAFFSFYCGFVNCDSCPDISCDTDAAALLAIAEILEDADENHK